MQPFNDFDCILCEQEHLIAIKQTWARTFFVCPDCGNKRCPKATWHLNPCSGSNDPGQVGSYYGVAPYKLIGV